MLFQFQMFWLLENFDSKIFLSIWSFVSTFMRFFSSGDVICWIKRTKKRYLSSISERHHRIPWFRVLKVRQFRIPGQIRASLRSLAHVDWSSMWRQKSDILDWNLQSLGHHRLWGSSQAQDFRGIQMTSDLGENSQFWKQTFLFCIISPSSP